jgi:hypothetical protein
MSYFSSENRSYNSLQSGDLLKEQIEHKSIKERSKTCKLLASPTKQTKPTHNQMRPAQYT